ncbi:hypothetical protein F4825DRAFT_164654 [Nemania diffusa]|nr:hypothetical protein F4825DRAFT_164654 [Nemania diffusa]
MPPTTYPTSNGGPSFVTAEPSLAGHTSPLSSAPARGWPQSSEEVKQYWDDRGQPSRSVHEENERPRAPIAQMYGPEDEHLNLDNDSYPPHARDSPYARDTHSTEPSSEGDAVTTYTPVASASVSSSGSDTVNKTPSNGSDGDDEDEGYDGYGDGVIDVPHASSANNTNGVDVENSLRIDRNGIFHLGPQWDVPDVGTAQANAGPRLGRATIWSQHTTGPSPPQYAQDDIEQFPTPTIPSAPRQRPALSTLGSRLAIRRNRVLESRNRRRSREDSGQQNAATTATAAAATATAALAADSTATAGPSTPAYSHSILSDDGGILTIVEDLAHIDLSMRGGLSNN